MLNFDVNWFFEKTVIAVMLITKQKYDSNLIILVDFWSQNTQIT